MKLAGLAWGQVFRALSKSPRTIVAPLTVANVFSLGSPRIKAKAPEGASHEERITALEMGQELIYSELDGIKEKAKRDTDRLEARIEDLSTNVEHEIQGIKEEQRSLSVGDLDVEIVGVVWLILGVILSSIP